MGAVAPSIRRLAASLLVVAAFLGALAIGNYKEPATHLCCAPGGREILVTREAAEKFGVEVTPAWTTPVAVGVGILGLALAVAIYRGRPNWPRAKGPSGRDHRTASSFIVPPGSLVARCTG